MGEHAVFVTTLGSRNFCIYVSVGPFVESERNKKKALLLEVYLTDRDDTYATRLGIHPEFIRYQN